MHVVGAERFVAGRLPGCVAGDRDGAEGAAVVAVAHRQDLVGLAGGQRGRERGGWRPTQAEGGEDADRAEPEPEVEQGGLQPGNGHAAGNGKGGEDGAHAVARRDHAGRKTPIRREPAHHEADHADIDDPGTQAAEQAVGEIEPGEAGDLGC